MRSEFRVRSYGDLRKSEETAEHETTTSERSEKGPRRRSNCTVVTSTGGPVLYGGRDTHPGTTTVGERLPLPLWVAEVTQTGRMALGCRSKVPGLDEVTKPKKNLLSK